MTARCRSAVPYFHSEEAAFAYVEARIWQEGPVCPHCGGCERINLMGGKSTRIGLYKRYQCRKPFTVKIGTIFESSHVALHIWLQAMYLIAGSKKGISSNQLHRVLGITLKTAWFMSHRIREAMQTDEAWPLGGLGATVEADQTFIGRIKSEPVRKGAWHKTKVFALVERGGRSRAMVVDSAGIPNLQPLMLENINRLTELHTDEAAYSRSMGRFFYRHDAQEEAERDASGSEREVPRRGGASSRRWRTKPHRRGERAG